MSTEPPSVEAPAGGMADTIFVSFSTLLTMRLLSKPASASLPRTLPPE